ncbi:hypothetical protein [Ferroplasma acidiphilum]|uniref:hypothetical protein n=1 Tax=Ferroplasma acidiphilum TaxID=74969 RepID=UPI002814F5FB|nr:hypothetical protein [Ferroplasma acidiphilum]WMT53238.1 MAG: hypothetical protein RE473_09555 [Ferroplasma acidiphilum]
MEDKMDKNMNFSENFVIISSRKMDFLTGLIEKLKSNPEAPTSPDIISEIVRIVASLDPLLFVSPKEIEERHLYLGTLLEDLDRKKIGEEIEKRMKDRIG